MNNICHTYNLQPYTFYPAPPHRVRIEVPKDAFYQDMYEGRLEKMIKSEIWPQPGIWEYPKGQKLGKVINQFRNRVGSDRLWRVMITDIPKPKMTQNFFDDVKFFNEADDVHLPPAAGFVIGVNSISDINMEA